MDAYVNAQKQNKITGGGLTVMSGVDTGAAADGSQLVGGHQPDLSQSLLMKQWNAYDQYNLADDPVIQAIIDEYNNIVINPRSGSGSGSGSGTMSWPSSKNDNNGNGNNNNSNNNGNANKTGNNKNGNGDDNDNSNNNSGNNDNNDDINSLDITPNNFDPSDVNKRPLDWGKLKLKRVLLKEFVDRLEGAGAGSDNDIAGDQERKAQQDQRRASYLKDEEDEMVKEVMDHGRLLNLDTLLGANTLIPLPGTGRGDRTASVVLKETGSIC